MTSAIESRFEIEVLEPLLLMSASSFDCEATDFDADSGFDAFSPTDNSGNILTAAGQTNEAARYWGPRSDYTIEDQGFGIFTVKSDSGVDFVTDVQEIEFEDGRFAIGDLLTEAESTEPDEELVSVYFAPIERELTLQDILAPNGFGESPVPLDGPPLVIDDLAALLDRPLEIEPPPGSIEFFEREDEPIRFVDPPPRLPDEWPVEFQIEFLEVDTFTPQPTTIISEQPSVIFLDTPQLFEAEQSVEAQPESEPESQFVIPDDGPLILLPFPVAAESTSELDRVDSDEWITEEAWFSGDVGDPIAQSLVTVTASDLAVPIALPVDAAAPVHSVAAIESFDDCPLMPLAENNAPYAQDDTLTVQQDTAIEGTVASNDGDPDGNPLMFFVEDGPVHGSIEFYQDGTYTYTPDPGFSGQDTFTYQISDQQCGTDTAVVTIVVAPQPNECLTAVDDEFATCANEEITGNVLINDVDSDTLTTSPMSDALTSEGGLVTLQQDGSFVYLPAAGFSGVDTFEYSMSDGSGGTASATVSITVHAIAEPQDDAFSGDEGTNITGDVILNDGTITAGSSVVVVDSPANGTLTLNTDGTFNYLPNEGYVGEDTFSYTVTGPCGPSETASVRMVVTEIEWDTTIVSSGNGQIWGDPHFEGDDGGLFDVQGEAGHIYNLLSDHGLQVNALFIPWEGHEGSTMVGAIGVRIGDDLIESNLSGTDVNGVALQHSESRVLGATTVEFDGQYTTITTAEYKLEFHKRDGWLNIKLDTIDPFADNVAPHGLWGLTVDGDSDARHGDYFQDNWYYALQGGGAIDTVDADDNIVVSQRGDDSAYKLYEVANLFSTEALQIAGDPFFRFEAEAGTGLQRV